MFLSCKNLTTGLIGQCSNCTNNICKIGRNTPAIYCIRVNLLTEFCVGGPCRLLKSNSVHANGGITLEFRFSGLVTWKQLCWTSVKNSLYRQFWPQVKTNKSDNPVTWRELFSITVWIFSILGVSPILHGALLSPIRLLNGLHWESCTMTDKGTKSNCRKLLCLTHYYTKCMSVCIFNMSGSSGNETYNPCSISAILYSMSCTEPFSAPSSFHVGESFTQNY